MSNSNLIPLVERAVKSLRGENFDVYDTSGSTISFGFRTWDIPKEFEDQRDSDVEAVITKFQQKIVRYIDDPTVTVTLWQGDKNYLEGELTLAQAPAKV